MEVAPLEVDREEARKRVEEFTAKRRRKLTEMDQALYRGYKALAEGLTLIDVNQAIRQGGHFEDTYCPKLALARSDVETVFFNHHFTWGDTAQHGGGYSAWSAQADAKARGPFWEECQTASREAEGLWETGTRTGLMLRFNDLIESPEGDRKSSKRWYKSEYRTLVPPIPFHLRPNGDAAKYFILWEVEKWEEWRPSRAPGDPFLLERIAHPIYVVVAQWDLTELERRILESFRR